MRQITIELPLDILPSGSVPIELLEKSVAMRFLRLDFSGFLLICYIPKNELAEMVKFLKEYYRQLQRGKIRVSCEGDELLLISGVWWNDGRPAYAQESSFAKLDAIHRSQTYFLKPPEIVENNIRITLISDSKSLRAFQTIFRESGLNYSVKKLGGLEKNMNSVLDQLTPRQNRILRIAHAKGYYRIPREINTQQIADTLKMDKGTVGEHLRKVEEKIIDYLLTA